MSRAFWFGAALALCPAVMIAQSNVGVNPVYQRAQSMVNDGNATAGRALVDSMVAVAQPGSNDFAEAIYWRAVLASTAADAEMDYRRIAVDFPTSPRAEDALIRLAQLELARGNYDGALKHLSRLATEHPDSPARGRAGYWTARALFDKNDLQGGCAAITDALTRTSETDTELRNQINYLNQRCAGVAAASTPVSAAPASADPVAVAQTSPAPAPPDTASKTAGVDSATKTVAVAPITVDSVVAKPPAAVKPPPRTVIAAPPSEPAPAPKTTAEPTTAGKRVWSVQVAAYNVKSQADAMVAKLKKDGYEARVDGTSAPFRVRIGQYATSGQAGAVQRSLKTKQITGFVVQADIR